MNIVILDYKTLGDDLELSAIEKYGTVTKYPTTDSSQAAERIENADIVILNKVKLTYEVLRCAKHLKLICETATGYDNIDVEYCSSHGITVTNTPAYSTACVAQLTVTMATALVTHLNEYREFVHSGEYERSESANRLTPIYHEINGMTWGIIGYGNIGKAVGKVAEALGCHVVVNKRTPEPNCERVELDELLRRSDIISIHCPLTEKTRGMIGAQELALMKSNAIIINVARGAIWDEVACAEAVLAGRIAGLGCDVFSAEPISKEHPFSALYGLPNVILTPHMAWGSYESRKRCFDAVLENIEAFLSGKTKNVVK